MYKYDGYDSILDNNGCNNCNDYVNFDIINTRMQARCKGESVSSDEDSNKKETGAREQ